MDKRGHLLQSQAQPLRSESDLDFLVDAVGDCRVVMLGEASHGTHEFYLWRAALSRRLIEERGFSFVAVEGDWPDCYEVNRYIKGYPGAPETARGALRPFDRWPTWMWANEEVQHFIEWLKGHNRYKRRKIGFYGLDLYSLWESLEAIIRYLQGRNPAAVELAYKAYDCFELYGREGEQYALGQAFVDASCETEVVELLMRLRAGTRRYDQDHEARFNAEQNALVAHNAERYYRTMMKADIGSWNQRDRHMMETLDRLLNFAGPDSKALVWAHNTHIGDAAHTSMRDEGEINIGQLAREKYGEENVYLIGQGTYKGSVVAGTGWGAPMKRMTVPPARPGSWDSLLHEAIGADSQIIFGPEVLSEFIERIGQRAIGVVYNPAHEFGNYVPSVIPRRYDAYIYFDTSEALRPIDVTSPIREKVPETFSAGV